MEKYKQALRDFLAGVMPGRENALVFGEGPLHPKLMLIGEAPGEQETLMGRPVSYTHLTLPTICSV